MKLVSELATVKQLERDLGRKTSLAEAFESQVRYYEAETASHMVKRGIKKMLSALNKFRLFTRRGLGAP